MATFTACLQKNKLEDGNYYVIAIPITKRSQRTRGYNQSLLLAKTIVSNTQILVNVLVKTSNHLPQNKIKNRNERLSNVKNSFGIVHRENIVGKNIILIDDVTTTGATLVEAKKVLLKAGAQNVFGFTIAH